MPAPFGAATAAEAPKLPPDLLEDLRQEVLALEEAERQIARSGRMEAWLYHYLRDAFDSAPGDFHRGIYADVEGLVFQQGIAANDSGYDLQDRLAPEELDELEALEAEALERRREATVYDAAAFAYPRGHGKTTTLVIGLALWVIHEWRSMPHFNGKPPFIVIVCGTDDQARDRALDIRDQLEGNALLREDYGDLTPWGGEMEDGAREQKWTEADYTTRDGCRIIALGSGSKKVRGLLRSNRRPTLILGDDLENDDHVQTEKQRGKLRRWLTKALIPTGIEGELLTIVCGTLLHADSLLARLLSREHFPGWLKRRFAALYADNGLPSVTGTISLWPSKWPVFRLQARRRKIGSVAFSQEYLNQPVDDETALFLMAWLRAAIARGSGRGFLYDEPDRIPFDLVLGTWDPGELAEQIEDASAYQLVVTAWDFGLQDDERKAKERDSDYTVGITLGLRLDDRIELRRIYRARGLTPGAVRDRVINEQEILAADYVAVENNAAQKLHELELRELPGLKGHLVGHTTDKRKHSVYEGVPGMALLFELDRIDLCWRTRRERQKLEVLIAELHGLGNEAHDDTVLALWMAITVIRRWMRMRDGRRRKLIGPPPSSYHDPFPTREESAA